MRSKFKHPWPAFYFNNWDVGYMNRPFFFYLIHFSQFAGCLFPVRAKEGKNSLKML